VNDDRLIEEAKREIAEGDRHYKRAAELMREWLVADDSRTQAQLGRRLGISQQRVSQILTGRTTATSTAQMSHARKVVKERPAELVKSLTGEIFDALEQAVDARAHERWMAETEAKHAERAERRERSRAIVRRYVEEERAAREAEEAQPDGRIMPSGRKHAIEKTGRTWQHIMFQASLLADTNEADLRAFVREYTKAKADLHIEMIEKTIATLQRHMRIIKEEQAQESGTVVPLRPEDGGD
jgi:transcriptional regulator with XRE-family HTH domain